MLRSFCKCIGFVLLQLSFVMIFDCVLFVKKKHVFVWKKTTGFHVVTVLDVDSNVV